VSIGAATHQNRHPTFKFERGWLTRDVFFDMVADIWQSERDMFFDMVADIWQSESHGSMALERSKIRLETSDNI
jgi:hypothetical protein